MYDIPWILLRAVEELSAGVEWNLPASAGFNELSWFDLCLFLFFLFWGKAQYPWYLYGVFSQIQNCSLWRIFEREGTGIGDTVLPIF